MRQKDPHLQYYLLVKQWASTPGTISNSPNLRHSVTLSGAYDWPLVLKDGPVAKKVGLKCLDCLKIVTYQNAAVRGKLSGVDLSLQHGTLLLREGALRKRD